MDSHYNIYREVIAQVLSDSERLPSLPSITLKIRQAIADDNTTVETLAQIIAKDPALCALLIKTASSVVYQRAVPPKTIGDVIGLLGFQATNNLVMLHSVNSLFVMKSANAKKLFALTWQRLIVKISVAHFLAKHLKRSLTDSAQLIMLLSEVGSLAVLSAIFSLENLPNEETYYEICRNYSRSLGIILLKKWNIDNETIDAAQECGNWQASTPGEINLLDLCNLSLYYTVRLTVNSPNLPPLTELAAYHKLPTSINQCEKENWLSLITDNKDELRAIVNSYKQ